MQFKTSLLAGLAWLASLGAMADTNAVVVDAIQCQKQGKSGDLQWVDSGISNASPSSELTVVCPIFNNAKVPLKEVSIWYNSDRGFDAMRCALMRSHWDINQGRAKVDEIWNELHATGEFQVETIWAGNLGSTHRDLGTTYRLKCILPKNLGNKRHIFGAYYFE